MAEGDADIVERAPVNKEDEDLMREVRTAFFRDGERRVDMVLVAATGQKEANDAKCSFFESCLRVGLQLEMEGGVAKKYKTLTFIKVHAPDELLHEFSEGYEMKTYFKEEHAQYTHTGNGMWRFIAALPFLPNLQERQWIQLSRRNDPSVKDFTTYERSAIVHNILLNLPFGNGAVGIELLLDNKLILDIFPMHEGPFFFVPKQELSQAINARQILFYKWIGVFNFFKKQPIHLIREYLGEKVAFFFGFFEYYNMWLLAFSLYGFAHYFFFIKDDNILYTEAINASIWYKKNELIPICKQDKWLVCPKCRHFELCPVYIGNRDCAEALRIMDIDHRHITLVPIALVMTATAFLGLWKRHSYYLSWIWETHRYKHLKTKRHQYRPAFRKRTRCPISGIMRYDEWLCSKILRNLVVALIWILTLLFILAMVMFMIIVHYRLFLLIALRTKDRFHVIHKSLALFGHVVIVFLFILECGLNKFYKFWTYFEENEDWERHESSLAYKRVIFSALFPLLFICYIAFLKQNIFEHPADFSTWLLMDGVFHQHCGLMGCVYQTWIIYTSIVLTREGLARLPSFCEWWLDNTDYDSKKQRHEIIPSWEKEYALKPFTDQNVDKYYKDIALQFSLVTSFVCFNVKLPLVIFFLNLFVIRLRAQCLLLRHRRPLVRHVPDIKYWLKIFFLLLYISGLTNIIASTLTSRHLVMQELPIISDIFIPRHFSHLRGVYLPHYRGWTLWKNFHTVIPPTKGNQDVPAREVIIHSKRNKNVSKERGCMFPGYYKLNVSKGGSFQTMYIPANEYSYYSRYFFASFFAALLHNGLLILAPLMWWAITRKCEYVKEAIIEEERRIYYTQDDDTALDKNEPEKHETEKK